jgi:hypothetical protein
MTRDEIVKMQMQIGTVPDGFWGPESIKALRRHLRFMMPSPSPWPRTDTQSLLDYYGDPGDESNLALIHLPYEMRYDGKVVTRMRVHKRCSASLLRVLGSIKHLMEAVPDIVPEATDFGGCFNYRLKRGGSSWSLHAWGAAIDLDPGDNAFRASWPMQADMPLEIIEAFAREGWISAAAMWGYDAMHFQATQ